MIIDSNEYEAAVGVAEGDKRFLERLAAQTCLQLDTIALTIDQGTELVRRVVIAESRWRHDGSMPYLRNSLSTLRKFGITRQGASEACPSTIAVDQVRPADPGLPGLHHACGCPGLQ
jgi:hypothetical protein